MNKEIKPTYVTREQAKWLKEKEFDLPTYAYYSGLNFYTGEYKNHSQTTIGDTPMHKMLIGYTSAPEQHQVVEWLRVKHGIFIHVHLEVKVKGLEISNTGKYQASINRVNHTSVFGKTSKGDTPDGPYRKPQNSPQEAYSAAFDYILNNLI
jgi:hypothetical protein